LSKVTYSPSHRQAGASMVNIQLTFHTAPELCKNVSLAVLFGNDGNSRRVSKQLVAFMYIYIQTYSSQYGDAGRTNEIKKWNNSECRVPWNSSACHAGLACRRFGSPDIRGENVMKSNTEVLWVANVEVAVDVNAEKTKHMLVSLQENAGKKSHELYMKFRRSLLSFYPEYPVWYRKTHRD
jgi:hypothetical protein